MGYGFDRIYVAGSFGAQWRSSGFDDRLVGDAEIGATFSDRWSGRLRLAGVQSLDEGGPAAESPSGIGNGTSWNGIYLEVDYRLAGELRLGLIADAATLAVKRRSAGTIFSLYAATVF